MTLPACSPRNQAASLPATTNSGATPSTSSPTPAPDAAQQPGEATEQRSVTAADLTKEMKQTLAMIVLARRQAADDPQLRSNESKAFFKAIVELNTALKQLDQSMQSKDASLGQSLQQMVQKVEQVNVTYRYSGIKNASIQQGVESMGKLWATFHQRYGRQAVEASKDKNAPLPRAQQQELAQLKAQNKELITRLKTLEGQVSGKPAMAQETRFLIQKAETLNTLPDTIDGLLAALYLVGLLDGWYDGYYTYVEYVEPVYVEYFTPVTTYWETVEAVTVNINTWSYEDYHYEYLEVQTEVYTETFIDFSSEELMIVNSEVNSLDIEVNQLNQEVDSWLVDTSEITTETIESGLGVESEYAEFVEDTAWFATSDFSDEESEYNPFLEDDFSLEEPDGNTFEADVEFESSDSIDQALEDIYSDQDSSSSVYDSAPVDVPVDDVEVYEESEDIDDPSSYVEETQQDPTYFPEDSYSTEDYSSQDSYEVEDYSSYYDDSSYETDSYDDSTYDDSTYLDDSGADYSY